MKKLKQDLGKSVFEKRSGKEGSPRPPAFRGATLGEFLDVFYFIGRFFTARAPSLRPTPAGRQRSNTFRCTNGFVHSHN